MPPLFKAFKTYLHQLTVSPEQAQSSSKNPQTNQPAFSSPNRQLLNQPLTTDQLLTPNHQSTPNASQPTTASPNRQLPNRPLTNQPSILPNHSPLSSQLDAPANLLSFNPDQPLPHFSNRPLSRSSIKNYLSDTQHFLRFLRHHLRLKSIKPDHITTENCQAYKLFLQSNCSPATANRRLSSLRRFTHFLTATNQLKTDPAQPLSNLSQLTFSHLLFQFQTYLKSQSLSPSTIKNYLSDVKNYLLWAQKNIKPTDNNQLVRSWV